MTHDYRAAKETMPGDRTYSPSEISSWAISHWKAIGAALDLAIAAQRGRGDVEAIKLMVKKAHLDHIARSCGLDDEEVSDRLTRDDYGYQYGAEKSVELAIDHLSALGLIGGWRPIEGAPRDGTRILCCHEANGKWVRYIAFYAAARTLPFSDDFGDDAEDDDYAPEGFYADNCEEERVESVNPTKWQPLLAPPATGGTHE